MDQLKIKTVEITNFRSIRRLQCDLSDISVFVGQNDVGKSNILKALNLFFNGEVEPGRELWFNEDFNSAGHIQKRADEIRIKVTFSLPQSYHYNNGEYLVYEKRWRESGEATPEKSFYGLRENGKEITIKGKSNVRQLISRINYIYVPAIRGMNYFDSLRLRIYQTLTRIAEGSLSQASSTFEGNIEKDMAELLEATQDIFHEDVVLSFPEDLSKVFEKLDFLFGKDKISINRRGDGIKGQYIPVILNFISVSERKLPKQKQGAPYTFIWGYEEPENNMEVKKCMEMRNQFIEYVKNSISQILITSHSPVYYNIMGCRSEDNEFSALHVTKDKEKGTCIATSVSGLDEELGSVARMLDAYKEIVKELEKIKIEKDELSRMLAERLQPCLFVEGPTDKMVIERLLVAFGIEQNFIIDDNRGNGGGANFVLDTLKAWEGRKKHKKIRYNAAGLVDEDAWDKVREFDARPHPKEFVKRFVLKGSGKVKKWKQQNKFALTEYLEVFYPESVWEEARKRGWLEEKKRSEIFNASTQRAYVDGGKIEDGLLRNAPMYITHKIRDNKIGMAKLVCDLEDNQLREAFADIRSMLEEIAKFLNRKPANNG